jgi:hypothetical protein
MECHIDHGTGVPDIDAEICAAARRRLRFRPGVNRYGQRVPDWFAYGQRAVR